MLTSDVTLTPETYEVLKRVPPEWRDEADVIDGIAATTGQHGAAIHKRLTYLRSVALIERRRSPKITHQHEIRRTGRV